MYTAIDAQMPMTKCTKSIPNQSFISYTTKATVSQCLPTTQTLSSNRGNGLDCQILGHHTHSIIINKEAVLVTPINVRKLNIALDCVEPNIKNYLLDGFTTGFTKCYQADDTICCKIHTLTSAVKNKDIKMNQIQAVRSLQLTCQIHEMKMSNCFVWYVIRITYTRHMVPIVADALIFSMNLC